MKTTLLLPYRRVFTMTTFCLSILAMSIGAIAAHDQFGDDNTPIRSSDMHAVVRNWSENDQPAPMTFTGEISKVNQLFSHVEVKADDATDTTFVVNGMTVILVDGTTATYKDLKVGYEAKVVAERSAETWVARRIVATSP